MISSSDEEDDRDEEERSELTDLSSGLIGGIDMAMLSESDIESGSSSDMRAAATSR